MEGSPQPRETRHRAMERVEGGRSATEPVCFVDGAGEVGAGRIEYTRVLFGYYALIGHFRVAVLLGRYQQALELISVVSLEHTVVFSKAFGSQLSLFYNASFCYFMQEKYLEAAKLAETVAIFYDKYKKFVARTISERSLANLTARSWRYGVWLTSSKAMNHLTPLQIS